MKSHLKFFILTLLLLIALPAMASNQDLDFKEPSTIVLWLTPILTLAGTWLIKKVAPFVTGVVTLIVVPLMAAGITWLTSIVTGDANWTAQILAGAGAVLLHQLYENFNKSTS